MEMMYNSITSDDYTFVDNNFNEMWAVKLLTKFEGVVYHYGKITANVDGDYALATLKFQYEILDEGEYDQEELKSSEEFNNYIGDILSHTIQDAFDNEKYRIGDEYTNNSTEESINK